MAKKKGKKDGKKGKDKKKDTLSHHAREIYKQTISDLQNKIEWKTHLRSIIEEDVKRFREAFAIQRIDKVDAVKLLEDAIEDQKQIHEKIRKAIPDAESSKLQAEERRARELAANLIQMNEEKLSYDKQLEVLRKKLVSLESYDLENVDQKIKDIEKRMESEDAEDVFQKALEQEKRREGTFRMEMRDILVEEADSFQDELSGKLDKNFERIAEETRWWADAASSLRIASERLDVINEGKAAKLKAAQRELKQRKQRAVQARQVSEEQELAILSLTRQNEALEQKREDQMIRENQLMLLDKQSDFIKDNLEAQEAYLLDTFNLIKENETEIKALEEKLSNEITFGSQLAKIIENAQELVEKEVKNSLILTYDGPPKKKDTLEELKLLFDEATKFVYERNGRSIV